jgi:hypothetical protein
MSSIMNADKWPEIATSNKADQETMRDKVEKFTGKDVERVGEFIDRLHRVQSQLDRDVIEMLHYLLAPLTNDDDKMIAPVGNMENGREELSDKKGRIQERKKSKTKGPLVGKTRDEVIAVCNQHGLKTLDQLLFLLDKIQQAQRGNLQKS